MTDTLDSLPDVVSITVQHGPGGQYWPGVLALRQRVFGEEQGIVDSGATDPDDDTSFHAIAIVAQPGRRGEVVAAGRLTLNNQGRDEAIVAWVATEMTYRRRGIGREIMYALLDEADIAGIRETVLAAQRHAESFYGALGFVPSGAPYKVRGIPHRWMIRQRPR